MTDVISELKNESRQIQQKITNLESRMRDFQDNHDALNRVINIETRVTRIETLLTDKITHDRGLFADISNMMADIRAELRQLRDKMPAPSEKPEERGF